MQNLKVIVHFVLLVVIYAAAFAPANDQFQPKRRVKRVTNGVDVSEHDYKFWLSMKYTKDLKHFCGATRIGEKWAITAAHCVAQLKPTQFFVTTTDNLTILIDEILQKNFNPQNFLNDIALLKLKVRQDNNASTVLLPKNRLKPHKSCLILGTGATEYAGTNSKTLQAGFVKVLTYEGCLSKLGRVMTPDENTGMFCAGGKRVDACNGDSGGPILCKNCQGDYELSGIISYGMGCGTDGVPGVYTGVYYHLQWIKENME